MENACGPLMFSECRFYFISIKLISIQFAVGYILKGPHRVTEKLKLLDFGIVLISMLWYIIFFYVYDLI